jgi:CBS-domain-containing membrane protein
MALHFIAFFVWIGAAQEASLVQMKSALGGIPVGRAMLTDFQSLATSDSLGRAVELILAGSQQDFPVIDSGCVVGVLTRGDLLAAPRSAFRAWSREGRVECARVQTFTRGFSGRLTDHE